MADNLNPWKMHRWFEGTIRFIDFTRKFGLINAAERLPDEFLDDFVHFALEFAPHNPRKGDFVKFQLRKPKDNQNRAKPHAFRVLISNRQSVNTHLMKEEDEIEELSLASAVNRDTLISTQRLEEHLGPLAGEDASTNLRDTNDLTRVRQLSNRKDAVETKAGSRSAKVTIKKVHLNIKQEQLLFGQKCGKIVKITDTYGFIAIDTSKREGPDGLGDAGPGELYFSMATVSSGHLQLERGDEVSFSISPLKDPESKPAAYHVQLRKCRRNVDSVEIYLGNLLSKLENVELKENHYALVAVTCLAVWDCFGHCKQLSNDAIAMLNRAIVVLDERYLLKENMASVFRTLLNTPLFTEQGSRYSQYIATVLDEKRLEKVEDVYSVILLMTKAMPDKIRLIVRILEPVASYDFRDFNASSFDRSNECDLPQINNSIRVIQIYHKIKNFLYELLKLSLKSAFSDDYTDDASWDVLPLVPSVRELLTGPIEATINLRPVLVRGPYSSVYEYVDIYFRLLRADCLSALSKGVRDLLNGTLHQKDMNVYRNVSLTGIQITKNGSGMCLGLNFTPQRNISNWDQSPCLLYGNLLCISVSGTFCDPIWATVVSRELLKSHQIVVIELCTECNSISDSDAVLFLHLSGTKVLMVESPTYYKAYHPVLKSLQSLNPKHLSFQEEIIQCKQGGLPLLIDETSTFNPKTIYNNSEISAINVMSYIQHTPDNLCYGDTSLDQSQEAAIRTCLANRIAIVQGPPGTGKTYIGLKLIDILLSLSRPLTTPILILTYKNHSLDEFLKELVKIYPHDIARVGGRSQEKEIAACNLNELRKSNKMSRDVVQQIIMFQEAMEVLSREISLSFNDLNEQRYCSLFTLVDSLSQEQMTQFLLDCDWTKCKLKSLKQKSSEDGFIEVSNYVTLKEVKGLLTSCDSGVLYRTMISAEGAKDYHGSQLSRLLQAAFKLWLPSMITFQNLSLHFETNELINADNFISTVSAAVTSEADMEEKDIEDTLRERLAATAFTPQSKEELLKEMKMFGRTQHHDNSKVTLMSYAKQMIEHIPVDLLTRAPNLWKLSETDRAKLVQCLLYKQFQNAGKKFEDLIIKYQSQLRSKEEVEHQHRANILQNKKIVGMTVTGANINSRLVSQIRPEVILVEEAAEVLEPQLLPLMGNWVKHLIMIGDHKQLRPAVENYALCKNFHLDVSLMERLINNELSYSALNLQNRMRPEFAALLLDIYPNLQSNLVRVSGNSPPNCISSSMFFWNHSDPEIAGRSYINEKEADRAINLALFFILQGYKPHQITILSPYLGQTSLLRRKMKKQETNFPHLFATKGNSAATSGASEKASHASSVIIHTIDLYQGDENDIVIISLVRSNAKQQTGFVGILNRRCVAQSRSRCGLYFIGNKFTFSNSKTWSKLLECIESVGCIDDRLPLQCPIHSAQSVVYAESAEDIPLTVTFCSVPCNGQMSCGKHVCKKPCQPRHSHAFCIEDVSFVHAVCGHEATKRCSEDESQSRCELELPVEFEPCRHTGHRKCYENESEVRCPEPCTKLLSGCGHPCESTCGKECLPESCSICRKLREEEAKKRREAEDLKRKEYLAIVDKKIQQIKETPIEFSVHRYDLSGDGDTAAEFYNIMDRVIKYIQPGHNWFPHIKRIEKLNNISLELNYLLVQKKLFDPTYSELKFHGTNRTAIENIIATGFILPKGGKHMYGKGIYFASDSSKSAQNIYTKGSQMLLVCEVLLGRSMTVESAAQAMTLKTLTDKKYDSLFAKRNTKMQGGVLYDEFVIFRPEQAIPRYIVHYEATDYRSEDVSTQLHKQLKTDLTQENSIQCYSIAPTRAMNDDDTLQLHFRIAESQFLRLARRLGQTNMEVICVDFYKNPTLIEKFEAMQEKMKATYPDQEESKHILAFHGTEIKNIESIVTENFDIKKLSSSSGDSGWYGAGIYFSEFPDISFQYGSMGKLLLCKVLPGKTFICEERMDGQSLQTGYDSHGYGPDKQGRCKELVIFNQEQILPCYVVSFQ